MAFVPSPKGLGTQDYQCIILVGPKDSIQAKINAAPPGGIVCLAERLERECGDRQATDAQGLRARADAHSGWIRL